jgi:hypothetical protein
MNLANKKEIRWKGKKKERNKAANKIYKKERMEEGKGAGIGDTTHVPVLDKLIRWLLQRFGSEKKNME